MVFIQKVLIFEAFRIGNGNYVSLLFETINGISRKWIYLIYIFLRNIEEKQNTKPTSYLEDLECPQ